MTALSGNIRLKLTEILSFTEVGFELN